MRNEINKQLKSTHERYKPTGDRSFKIILFSVIGFFVGFGLCVGYYSCTLISFFDLSKLMVFFAIIGFLLPLKYYRRWFHFVKYEMILFNIIGISPLLAGFFLLINFTFITDSYTHQYRIEKIYFEGEQNYKTMGVILENNFFSGERKIVELTNIPPDISKKQFLKITISEGIFGFDVIKEKILIK